jgi:hypothetical protein
MRNTVTLGPWHCARCGHPRFWWVWRVVLWEGVCCGGTCPRVNIEVDP